MRRAAWAAVVCALGVVAPATASAQILESFGSGDARVVRVDTVPIAVSGGVNIAFAGDEAAGCAESGLCGYSGSVSWEPGARAEVLLFESRIEGVRIFSANLVFHGDEGIGEDSRTTATVSRALPDGSTATCADVRDETFASAFSESLGGPVGVGLTPPEDAGFGGVDLVRSRCVGPLHDDVARVLPLRRVPVRQLRRGRMTIDLGADAGFAAGGLSGIVRSNVSLRLGRGRRERLGGEEDRGPLRRRRVRAVSVIYSVESTAGELTADAAGADDPLRCRPVDACGLRGTLTVRPEATGGELILFATAPARFSRRRLLATLGIVRGRPLRRALAGGTAFWEDSGSVTARLARDGAATCTGSAPVRSGVLEVHVGARRLDVGYTGAALRTRCPGPLEEDVTSSEFLALGRVPLSVLRQRTVSLPVSEGHPFSRRGWQGATRANLAVVVRRRRIVEETYVELFPEGEHSGRGRRAAVRPGPLGLHLRGQR